MAGQFYIRAKFKMVWFIQSLIHSFKMGRIEKRYNFENAEGRGLGYWAVSFRGLCPTARQKHEQFPASDKCDCSDLSLHLSPMPPVSLLLDVSILVERGYLFSVFIKALDWTPSSLDCIFHFSKMVWSQWHTLKSQVWPPRNQDTFQYTLKRARS